VPGGSERRRSASFLGMCLVLAVILGGLGVIAAGRDTRPPGPTLYAYGTSYLAQDVSNSPGRRYIDQFDNAARPSHLHNLAKSGATVQDIAATVDRTWKPRQAIVVIDAVTNNLYQTRTDPARGIADAEPVFKSMLQRLGPLPSIIVVKQGHLSSHDYSLFDDYLSDATVDAWNAMIDRAVAGFPNVRVVDPNVGWDPETMMHNVHPTDAGEDHIARLLCAATGLPWRPPDNT
jgi:hypothetical protein